MKINYIKRGKKLSTRFTNNDLIVKVNSDGFHHTISVVSKVDGITLANATETIPFNVNFSDRYFLNGYQSWTDTNEYKLAKQLRDIKKSPHIVSHMYAMDKYGDSSFYRYSIRKSHGFDIFYSVGKYEVFLFSHNYRTAYLIIELVKDNKDLHLISLTDGIKLNKGDEVTIFDFELYQSVQEGLDAFNKAFPLKKTEKIFGYTSWYNYYQNINEEIINRDLEALDDRFNVFQIDDGYETFVGDWLDVDAKKFPNGLAPIVKKIHSKGYKAGIWLAPFAAESKSKLFKEHPEYLKRDKKGALVKAGGNWSGFYALDLEKEEVVNYIKKCLKHYMDMGFDFFKLDFLYASALTPVEGKSRAQVQYEAYKLLRDTLKGKTILGCGAYLMASYENFDYLRVGPDVSLVFDDVFFMRMFHRERISTKVTLQNTIYRSFLDSRLFGNDPDVFLLRDENISLSKKQKEALGVINSLFGSVLMTSDNIANYDEEKKRTLDTMLELFYKAKVKSYTTRGNLIHIEYELNGELNKLTYNAKIGEIKYGR